MKKKEINEYLIIKKELGLKDDIKNYKKQKKETKKLLKFYEQRNWQKIKDTFICFCTSCENESLNIVIQKTSVKNNKQ